MKDKWPLKTQTAENTKLSGPLAVFAMREVFFLFHLLCILYIAMPIFHVPILKAKVSYFFMFLSLRCPKRFSGLM